MKYLPISLGITATALFLYAAAQTVNTTPSLNQIMTPDEQTRTGVDKLTPDERTELETWIQTYTQSKVASLQQKTTRAKKVSMKPSFGVLTINVRGGQFLILTDSSVWEVSPDDIFTSSAWLASIAVEITYDNSDPEAYFPFIIKNQYSGLSVHARQASMDDIPLPTDPSDLLYNKVIVHIINVQINSNPHHKHIIFDQVRLKYSLANNHPKSQYFIFTEIDESEKPA
jgi:hypothetical protein